MPEQKRSRLQRVSDYLGLSEAPRDFQAGAYLNGTPVFGLSDVYNILSSGGGDVRVSRRDANRLAAVVSVRNRLQATVAGMPLEQRRKNGEVRENNWLKQPNPSRPLVNELADTVADLYYDGFAYWHVLKRGPGALGPGTGFPTQTEWVAFDRVAVMPDGGYRLDGTRVKPADLIQFDGIHAGILHEGPAAAINDALRLGRTAAMFTNSPFPLGYFQAREGAVDPDEDEIKAFLAEWASVRRRNAYGHVPSDMELKFPDIDPAKLQLIEARRETTADIARGTGENLENLGLPTTSRTYFNGTQVRKDQLDFQVALYTVPIAQRLSMPDCTPTGDAVQFSTDEFLSVDELTRMQIYALGLQVGVYADYDEVRTAEGKPPLTPAQVESRKTIPAPAAASPTSPGASQAPAK